MTGHTTTLKMRTITEGMPLFGGADVFAAVARLEGGSYRCGRGVRAPTASVQPQGGGRAAWASKATLLLLAVAVALLVGCIREEEVAVPEVIGAPVEVVSPEDHRAAVLRRLSETNQPSPVNARRGNTPDGGDEDVDGDPSEEAPQGGEEGDDAAGEDSGEQDGDESIAAADGSEGGVEKDVAEETPDDSAAGRDVPRTSGKGERVVHDGGGHGPSTGGSSRITILPVRDQAKPPVNPIPGALCNLYPNDNDTNAESVSQKPPALTFIDTSADFKPENRKLGINTSWGVWTGWIKSDRAGVYTFLSMVRNSTRYSITINGKEYVPYSDRTGQTAFNVELTAGYNSVKIVAHGRNSGGLSISYKRAGSLKEYVPFGPKDMLCEDPED